MCSLLRESSACDSSGLTRIGLIAHSDIQSCPASIFLRPVRFSSSFSPTGPPPRGRACSSLYWGFPSTLCCGAGRVRRRRPVNVMTSTALLDGSRPRPPLSIMLQRFSGRSCGAISINQLLGFQRSQSKVCLCLLLLAVTCSCTPCVATESQTDAGLLLQFPTTSGHGECATTAGRMGSVCVYPMVHTLTAPGRIE